MRFFCLFVVGVVLGGVCFGEESDIAVNEEFEDLDSWERHSFEDIEKQTLYKVSKEGTNSILVAGSDSSASGLIHTNVFDVRKYPVLEWRWKVDNVYSNGNAKKKSGDDYPLRIYVVFKYDPDEAGWLTSAKYALAKKVRGEYPPHSSLNYIWANRQHKEKVLPSPYTDRSQMILVREGKGRTGKWLVERVNVLEDYKKAFGEEPPEEASVAIMSDSDNTGEAAVAYVDYVRLRAGQEE